MPGSLKYCISSLKYSTLLAFRVVHLIILFSDIGISIILVILDNILLKSRRASLSLTISFYMRYHTLKGNCIYFNSI